MRTSRIISEVPPLVNISDTWLSLNSSEMRKVDSLVLVTAPLFRTCRSPEVPRRTERLLWSLDLKSSDVKLLTALLLLSR